MLLCPTAPRPAKTGETRRLHASGAAREGHFEPNRRVRPARKPSFLALVANAAYFLLLIVLRMADSSLSGESLKGASLL